ncbi:hypothetical protein HDV64DRAFT_124426 [Trichoderma sp. TUCIM 5745]
MQNWGPPKIRFSPPTCMLPPGGHCPGRCAIIAAGAPAAYQVWAASILFYPTSIFHLVLTACAGGNLAAFAVCLLVTADPKRWAQTPHACICTKTGGYMARLYQLPDPGSTVASTVQSSWRAACRRN